MSRKQHNKFDYDRSQFFMDKAGGGIRPTEYVFCECGQRVAKRSLNVHIKSSKHKRLMEENDIIAEDFPKKIYYSDNIIIDDYFP